MLSDSQSEERPPTISARAAIGLVLLSAVFFGTTGTSQTFAPDSATALSVGSARMVAGGSLMALVGLINWWRRQVASRRVAGQVVLLNDDSITAAAAEPVDDRQTGSTVAMSPARPPRLAGRGRGERGRPSNTSGARWPIPTWLALAVAAAGMATYQFTFFAGTRANGVAIGTIVTLGSSPLAAGVFEWLIRGVKPVRAWLIATGCAIIGVVLLSAAPGSVDLGGLALSISAGSAYALELVMMKLPLERGWSSSDAVSWVMGLAALFALPVLLTTDLAWLASPRGAAVVGWLALVTIVVAYQLLAQGLVRLPAATVTTLTLAEPATATLLGLIVLGERIPLAGVAGIAAIAAGLVILARAASRTPVAGADQSDRTVTETISIAPMSQTTGDSEAVTPVVAVEADCSAGGSCEAVFLAEEGK